MLTLVSGTFGTLSNADLDAIHTLTRERYVKDIIMSDEEDSALSRRNSIAAALRLEDERTYVSAIMARGGGKTVALAAMRTIRGSRSIALSKSIGDIDSSLPTHRLLTGFRYPASLDFDADRASESSVCECSRLVTIASKPLTDLVESRFVTSAEASYFARFACKELIVTLYLRESADKDFAGYIFTIQPRLAHVLSARLRLPLVPMFAGGASPTQATLTPGALFAPYFSKWHAELRRAAPSLMDDGGPSAVLSHLATHVFSHPCDSRISLPFFLPAGKRLAMAIADLQADLTGARPPETVTMNAA
jgi:hypothetical protein